MDWEEEAEKIIPVAATHARPVSPRGDNSRAVSSPFGGAPFPPAFRLAQQLAESHGLYGTFADEDDVNNEEAALLAAEAELARIASDPPMQVQAAQNGVLNHHEEEQEQEDREQVLPSTGRLAYMGGASSSVQATSAAFCELDDAPRPFLAVDLLALRASLTIPPSGPPAAPHAHAAPGEGAAEASSGEGEDDEGGYEGEGEVHMARVGGEARPRGGRRGGTRKGRVGQRPRPSDRSQASAALASSPTASAPHDPAPAPAHEAVRPQCVELAGEVWRVLTGRTEGPLGEARFTSITPPLLWEQEDALCLPCLLPHEARAVLLETVPHSAHGEVQAVGTISLPYCATPSAPPVSGAQWCSGSEALLSSGLAWHGEVEGGGLPWAMSRWAQGQQAGGGGNLLLLPYPHALHMPEEHTPSLTSSLWSSLTTPYSWPHGEGEEGEGGGQEGGACDTAAAAVDAVRDCVATSQRDLAFKLALWGHVQGLALAQARGRGRMLARARARGAAAGGQGWWGEAHEDSQAWVEAYSAGGLAASPLLRILVPLLDRAGPGDEGWGPRGQAEAVQAVQREAQGAQAQAQGEGEGGRPGLLRVVQALHMVALGLAVRRGELIGQSASAAIAPWVWLAAGPVYELLSLWWCGFGALPGPDHGTQAAAWAQGQRARRVGQPATLRSRPSLTDPVLRPSHREEEEEQEESFPAHTSTTLSFRLPHLPSSTSADSGPSPGMQYDLGLPAEHRAAMEEVSGLGAPSPSEATLALLTSMLLQAGAQGGAPEAPGSQLEQHEGEGGVAVMDPLDALAALMQGYAVPLPPRHMHRQGLGELQGVQEEEKEEGEDSSNGPTTGDGAPAGPSAGGLTSARAARGASTGPSGMGSTGGGPRRVTAALGKSKLGGR